MGMSAVIHPFVQINLLSRKGNIESPAGVKDVVKEGKWKLSLVCTVQIKLPYNSAVSEFGLEREQSTR